MKACHDFDLTMAEGSLIVIREHYSIPKEYALNTSLPGSIRDSPKGSGSSLRICWEITERISEDFPKECQRLLDWRESTTRTEESGYFGRLSRLGPTGKPPVPRYSGS
ncbi:hypothetical protein BHE74_00037729 [Ensete ventricosum]|nr:hypothetical protein BHE74_00037729 [Ensete ventricosum]